MLALLGRLNRWGSLGKLWKHPTIKQKNSSYFSGHGQGISEDALIGLVSLEKINFYNPTKYLNPKVTESLFVLLLFLEVFIPCCVQWHYYFHSDGQWVFNSFIQQLSNLLEFQWEKYKAVCLCVHSHAPLTTDHSSFFFLLFFTFFWCDFFRLFWMILWMLFAIECQPTIF